MGNEASITCCSGPGKEGLHRFEDSVGKPQRMPIASLREFEQDRINEWAQLGELAETEPWWCSNSSPSCTKPDVAGESVTKLAKSGNAYMVADSPDGALMSTEYGDGIGSMWLNPDEDIGNEGGNVIAVWDSKLQQEFARRSSPSTEPRSSRRAGAPPIGPTTMPQSATGGAAGGGGVAGGGGGGAGGVAANSRREKHGGNERCADPDLD
eukprot:CAMPEP_0206433572 /NCGR_PEP_ID=MMETSP0324_2-20121206/8611_1 /ASSEMBLY_ACC=CAM_ASM_000836 /TAXON_ID=2866 /ORGANISM="Crypthecodinium cohnii, Strain Seligo" /LENGTH=209 /DNA_ID=CAMNT_0053899859 /DNA_START=39 /DNA_END=665 /DNA_ORIENTATION=+